MQEERWKGLSITMLPATWTTFHLFSSILNNRWLWVVFDISDNYNEQLWFFQGWRSTAPRKPLMCPVMRTRQSWCRAPSTGGCSQGGASAVSITQSYIKNNGDIFLQPVSYCNIQCIHQKQLNFTKTRMKKSFCESSVYDRSRFWWKGSHFL